jgi:single-stranded DNA-binding protein
MPQYEKQPLSRAGGVIVKGDPIEKETSRGKVVEFTIIQDSSTSERDENGKWQSDSEFVDVAVWGDKLRAQVLEHLYKGSRVFVAGAGTPKGQYNEKINARRVQLLTDLPASSDADF